MKTLDTQNRQAQSVNIDLGMPDIARFSAYEKIRGICLLGPNTPNCGMYMMKKGPNKKSCR
jgi:hypothetical protein